MPYKYPSTYGASTGAPIPHNYCGAHRVPMGSAQFAHVVQMLVGYLCNFYKESKGHLTSPSLDTPFGGNSIPKDSRDPKGF